MPSATLLTSPLAQRMLAAVDASGSVTAPYRLARMVARVLVSTRLRERRKWCALAADLAGDPAVEERLVHQAMGWLRRGRGGDIPKS